MPRKRKSKPRSPDQAALGRAIELFIAEAHMTQKTVARESGLTVKRVGELVRGQSNPTYFTILKLCRGLRVSAGELLTRVGALRRDEEE